MKIELIISIISILIAIASFIFSMVSFRKSYKLEKTDKLKGHSEKIKEELKGLTSRWESVSLLNPLDLPINEDWYSYKFIQKLSPYAAMHLQTGYEDLYKLYQYLFKEMEDYNKKIINFLLSLIKAMQDKLQLPSFISYDNSLNINDYPKPWFDYKKVIYRILNSIIGKCIYHEGYFKFITYDDEVKYGKCFKKFSLEGPILFQYFGKENYTCIIAIVDEEKVEAVKQCISELTEQIKEEVLSFYYMFCKLQNGIELFSNRIQNEIISAVEYGGIIKGNCEICK